IDALTEVIKSGKWGCLHGTKVKQFEKAFADFHNAKFGVCLNSGTTGLRIALLAVGVGPGDEVLVPGYTFIASATAVIETGATPIFVDIDSETYNIDPERIEASITPRTKAIMPVHFAGRPVDMDRILEISQKHHLKVVEDAAQAWGSEWNGKKVGTLGNAGVFSFQSSKNITCGEGGIILTNDEEVAKLCRSHSNCGRLEGGIWYEHYYYGGNFRMTEFQGAVLLVQLARYPELKHKREENVAFLNQHLARIEGVEPLKRDPRITSHSCHIYIFRYKKEYFNDKPKARFIEALKKEGIPASAGYSIPLYTQPVFKKRAFGPLGKPIEMGVDYTTYHLPQVERACYEEAIWFTQNVLLGSQEDMKDIVRAIEKIRECKNEL
ncbi:MAG: DegT/DnrJ/EryC1/StrS family aminotransferase, partial [candidate division KSB1 bacterium]|nr:DegT/DnrJ/EryC1/StrS family aminotransferase [candidate division KSB1 bacterium]